MGEFTAEELQAGVNLAGIKAMPQRQQAEAVLELIRKWRRVTAYHERLIAQVERMSPLKNLPRPIRFEEAEALLKAERPQGSYREKLVERYRKAKPKEAALRQEVLRLRKAIRLAAQPAQHDYELRRKSPASEK